MAILGIIDNHDTGVAVFKDGEIIFAVNEERLNRDKITREFPFRSIRLALNNCKIEPREIERIVVGGRITPPFLLRLLNKWYVKSRGNVSVFSYSLNLYFLWQVLFCRVFIIERFEVLLSTLLFKVIFYRLGFRCPITFIDHHLCHAASAYYTCGFDKALIITMDGIGDSRSVTVSMGEGQDIQYAIHQESGLSSVATFYLRITEYLKFTPMHHEGKVMALAAYGDSGKAYDIVKKLLQCNGESFSRNNLFVKQSKESGIYAQLRIYKLEDVAAATQRVLEEEVSKFVRIWMVKTNSSNLVLAGGLFANIKLNQKLAALEEIKKIYIFPHMGDGGLAYGSLLAYKRLAPKKLENIFLGPFFSKDEILREIKLRNILAYYQCEDVEKEIAQFLARHKLVARFSGKMEYGPRALGNRSILFEAVDGAIKERLNTRLKRTEFMPFAPVLQYEDKDRYFCNTDKADHAAEFMNMSFACKQETIDRYPGVVHIDNTARPQFVRKDNNPGMHKILEYYKKISGFDMLINTSFNMHEEPIVCEPKEALDTFCNAELDYLVFDDFVVTRK